MHGAASAQMYALLNAVPRMCKFTTMRTCTRTCNCCVCPHVFPHDAAGCCVADPHQAATCGDADGARGNNDAYNCPDGFRAKSGVASSPIQGLEIDQETATCCEAVSGNVRLPLSAQHVQATATAHSSYFVLMSSCLCCCRQCTAQAPQLQKHNAQA